MLPEISIYIAVFASVVLAVWALGALVLNWGSAEQRQIRKLSHGRGELLTDLHLTDVPTPWAKRFQQAVPKSPKEMSALRRRLTTAGYRDTSTAVIYSLAEITLPFIFAGLGLLYFGFS